MDTSLQRSSAVLPLSSRLYPLLTQLKDAVKDLNAAKAKTPTRQIDPHEVDAVLETISTTIQNDEGMKARPGLAELVTPSNDPTKLPAISRFFKMATSAPMRTKYYQHVIDRLTQEFEAAEGGRRRRRKTRKTRKSRKVSRRR